MKQRTECKRTVTISVPKLLQKLEIDGKLKNIKHITWISSYGMFLPGYKPTSRDEIVIEMEQEITNLNGNDTQECNKTITLEPEEFMNKLEVEGKLSNIDYDNKSVYKDSVKLIMKTTVNQND